MMVSSLYSEFKANRLSNPKIINIILTELGAGLYGYMIMLQNTDRAQEGDLIHKHRLTIFSLRDKLGDRDPSEAALVGASDTLHRVHDLFAVQVTMLRVNPLKVWECAFFQSYQNELLNFAYLLNPNKS